MSSTTSTASRPTVLERVRARWTWSVLVSNLVAQIVIVVTGGTVRLTASGLGCSTYPECEPGEFTPQFHDATSAHPFIEFGNRTLTGVLLAVAVAVALVVFLDRHRTASYRRLGLAPLVGVLAQAAIGGAVVLLELPPILVGLHMLVSMGLVAVSTWLLVRFREGDGVPEWQADHTTRRVLHLLWLLTVVVLVLGVVVTGAGPHSGDDEVGYRLAVDPYLMAKVHAAAVWGFVATLVVLLVRVRRAGLQGRSWTSGLTLLAVTLAQGLIGYVQTLTGLPVALVNLHMLGAALLTSAVASCTGALRTRAQVAPPAATTPAPA